MKNKKYTNPCMLRRQNEGRDGNPCLIRKTSIPLVFAWEHPPEKNRRGSPNLKLLVMSSEKLFCQFGYALQIKHLINSYQLGSIFSVILL